ncbi:MAG TPA: hypothetical protein VN174_01090 [Candidatus Methanoperedens sp.]|nr:hypothetical protein [Candidatus Methanoperedens sp.]
MKCPKCDQEMIIEIGESPAKLKTDEIFNRTVYCCKKCNVYVGVYLPLSN